jgi:tetratricopeptide (TPR) repeat protein
MRRWAELAGLLLAAGLVAVAPRLAAQAHDVARDGPADERLYLPDGELLRHASLGFHAPVADWTWLQATQYYGGFRNGEHDLRYFDGLVDAVTTLDPQFTEAYRFASLVHSLTHGDQQRAIAVLRRGILANPDDWQLHFELGFIHYVFLQEYQLASHYFQAAAALPGASDFCQRFAAFSKRRAGDMRGSLALWQNLYRTTTSEDMRELATEMIGRCEESLAGAPRRGFVGPPTPQPGQTP